MDKYDITYRDVLCTGVEWNGGDSNKFYFVYHGNEYHYVQETALSFISDTDYIRCAIDWFLDNKIMQRVLCINDDASHDTRIHGCLYRLRCTTAELPLMVAKCINNAWTQRDAVQCLVDFEDLATPEFRACKQIYGNGMVYLVTDDDSIVARFEYDCVAKKTELA